MKKIVRLSMMIVLSVVMTGCTVHHHYNSYTGLVMAGYQGWFNAEGDGADRGFYHYRGSNGFRPGSASVDMWPDVSEYELSYPTEFTMPDGSVARVFSSEDYSTVDTHFYWMKKYGLDGVFMQRFVSEIKRPSGKKHFDKVLDHAMKAARKYDRAIAVMYDLSGMHPEDVDTVLSDVDVLAEKYGMLDHKNNGHCLYHNGRPLVAIWGVGFDDGRRYGVSDAEILVDGLRERGFSILIGVPTNWRTLDGDTQRDPALHALIRKCDVVMPWFVGRYTESRYEKYKSLIEEDIVWAKENGVDYAPLAYPGFSWANMKGKHTFNVPRNSGVFFRKQLDGALELGARMLYIAMFDEIDEGTAIFKCSKTVPVSEKGTEFVPIDADIPNDLYLRLAGEASRRLKRIKY